MKSTSGVLLAPSKSEDEPQRSTGNARPRQRAVGTSTRDSLSANAGTTGKLHEDKPEWSSATQDGHSHRLAIPAAKG